MRAGSKEAVIFSRYWRMKLERKIKTRTLRVCQFGSGSVQIAVVNQARGDIEAELVRLARLAVTDLATVT